MSSFKSSRDIQKKEVSYLLGVTYGFVQYVNRLICLRFGDIIHVAYLSYGLIKLVLHSNFVNRMSIR